MARLQIYRRLILKDAKGKTIKDSGWTPCRSYVRNFLRWVFALITAASNVTLQDTGGNNRDLIYGYACNYLARRGDVMAGVGVDTYGIQVGTGTTAESNTDDSLDTQITHGVGPGQLQYGGMGETDPAIIGANVDALFSRNFTNGSGGSITIEEIGMVLTSWSTGGAQRYFLILRDLVTQAVANGQTLTVQYTLRTTA